MKYNRQSRVANRVQIALVRDEILTTRSTIAVDVPVRADPEFVARAVGVLGVDGQLWPTRSKGRFRWVPGDDIPAGRYTLVVEALADRDSRRISEPVEVPFTVVATAAKIPDRLRMESFVRIRLGAKGAERLGTDSLPEGQYIDFIKAADRRTGNPVALSFDQDGRQMDGEARLAEHFKELSFKLGRVHPVLDVVARSAKQDEGEDSCIDGR
jgi:hypothetical protein